MSEYDTMTDAQFNARVRNARVEALMQSLALELESQGWVVGDSHGSVGGAYPNCAALRELAEDMTYQEIDFGPVGITMAVLGFIAGQRTLARVMVLPRVRGSR